MKRLLAALTTVCTLAACSGGPNDASDSDAVAFESTQRIASDDGVAASQQLFSKSDEVVVAGEDLGEQWAGAKEAISSGVPLLIGDSDAVRSEVDRLGAKEVRPEAATQEQLEEDGVTKDNLRAKIAELQPKKDRGGDPILTNKTTSIASLATAKASGGNVELIASNDPRESASVMEHPEDPKVLALGAGFAADPNFDGALALAKNGEVAGGGGILFPGRRMIALYGHPQGGALGALGEQDPEASVARAKELARQYEPLSAEPVLPAFEIIASVASSDPGPGNTYSNETDPEELRPYIEAITKAGGYAVIDLQPGRANFLDQAKRYESLLKLPNVGLALDPEWRIGPNEVPLTRVGSVDVAEINETAEWLAGFVRENNLPQKALVIHQFQVAMIENREDLNTNHPELSFVLHADGHGVPDEKLGTWNVLLKDLPAGVHMAWKNFFDEDKPMFTPQQTFDVKPKPWFVSYQ